MPTIPFTEIPVGFAQVTFDMAAPGQSGAVNIVIGVENVADEDAAGVAGIVGAIFQTNFVEQFLAAPVTYLGCKVELGLRPGGPTYELPADGALPIQGDQGAEMLPLNNAMLILKHTQLGGRAGRGRMYVPGVAEGIIDNAGVMPAVSLAQFQTSAGDFLDALDSNGERMVLLHSQPKTADGPPPVYGAAPAPTVVSSLQVSPLMATQRTRLRG